MSIATTVKELVRPDRVKHTIEENKKIQAKYKPKPVPYEHKYMGSAVKAGDWKFDK